MAAVHHPGFLNSQILLADGIHSAKMHHCQISSKQVNLFRIYGNFSTWWRSPS